MKKEVLKVLGLHITHPELSKQADGWNPKDINFRSDEIRPWICQLKHTWSARVSTRSKGVGCPFCSGRKVWPGFNDLKSNYPEIASELVSEDPSLVNCLSRKFFTWNCPKGHTWEATAFSRTKNGTTCRICSNEIALSLFNDLATTHPEIAQFAFRWDPSKYTATSKKIRTWRCDKFHIWNSTIRKRIEGPNCPKCVPNDENL
jgi:hypothetical protein